MNKQNITNDIKAPNNDLEILRKNFPHCFDKDGNFQLEKFKNNLADKDINFSRESYELEWLGKSYARLLASDPATTLLKADETHNAKVENVNSENLLIKGDNLEVLKHLSNAYYEKVKMIYIDPPYNTGSDGFVYNDDRKFTIKELQNLIGVDAEKAKRILSFTQSKSNSHSAWLTFMYPRLYIAKQLLKDDGVIFVSIDDNEVAQLRLLMDEIFGEENFVLDLIRKTKSTTNDAKTGVNTQHENCLVYTKNINAINLLGEEKDLSKYKNSDNDTNGEWTSGDPSAKSGSQANYFEIKNPYTGKIDLPPEGRYWAFSQNTIQKHIDSEVICFKKEHKENERGFIYKRYKDRLKTTQKTLDSLVFTDNLFMNQKATKDLLDLGLAEYFTYPKGTDFISKITQHSTSENDLILDFFAGSGTTGDAVMQLNAQDGGNRKFILVQLPEPINQKKNKTAFDFVKNELGVENPTIFEITKERLIRASKKISEELSKDITKSVDEYDLGFKIFETTPIWEDYDFEAEQFDSSQTLFDAGKLTEEDIKSLLVTWKTYDGIALTVELETIDLSGYTAFYGSSKLYLMNKGFTTENLKNLLEKIDADKKFNPASIIAFGYHFESARLREISENIKSYANKKKIDIDFITRY